jgi:hypothetical protein
VPLESQYARCQWVTVPELNCICFIGVEMSVFLTVPGLDSGGNFDGKQGVYLVKGFTFDVTGTPLFTTAHKSVFAPLMIDYDQDAHLHEFFDAADRGILLSHVQLQVTAPSCLTVYELRLENVLVMKITDGKGVDRLELDVTCYGSVRR